MRADIQTSNLPAISPAAAARVEAQLAKAQFPAIEQGVLEKPRQAAAPNGQLLSVSATCGPPTAPVVCPQIVELARSLKNDPRLIYEYVLNNIEYIPEYGLLKGSFGTLINGAGTNFDIAQLTADLLNQAGYNATLVKGMISISSTAAAAWLGVNSTDSCSLANMFIAGGIPATNRTPTTCPGAGSFQVTEVWVKVTVGGTTYLLDSSVKQHGWIAGSANLASITGYDRASYLAAACGASACNAAQTVTNLNRATILDPAATQSVPTFATKLLAYMQTNAIHDARTMIGGPSTIFTPVPTLPLSLPYTVVSTTTDPFVIDGKSKSALEVQIAAVGIDQYFSSDQLEGKRLTLFFDGTGHPVLALDGTAIATGTPPTRYPVSIALHVCHPFPLLGSDCSKSGWAHPNTSPNQVVNQTLLAGGSFLISSGWGRENSGMIQYHQSQLAKAFAAGGTSASEPVLGEALAVLSSSWIAQTDLQADLTLSLQGVMSLFRHQVGIAGQTTGPYVDLPGNDAAFTPTTFLSGNVYNSAAATTAFYDLATQTSVLESSSVNQVFNQSAVSTAKLLDINMTPATSNSLYDLQTCADLTAFEAVNVGWAARASDIMAMHNTLCPMTGPAQCALYCPSKRKPERIPHGNASMAWNRLLYADHFGLGQRDRRHHCRDW